jgi:hypothetical protein
MAEVREAVPRRGALFWLSAGAGWSVILWGVRGALHHHIDTRPAQLVRFLLGGALLHDLVLAPAVLLTGVLVARAVRGPWRAPLQAALFISAALALFTYPQLRGYGRVLHNPTSLPHNYAANLTAVVAAVAAAIIALTLVSASRRRGGAAPAPGPPAGSSSSGPGPRPTGRRRSPRRPPGRARSC